MTSNDHPESLTSVCSIFSLRAPPHRPVVSANCGHPCPGWQEQSLNSRLQTMQLLLQTRWPRWGWLLAWSMGRWNDSIGPFFTSLNYGFNIAELNKASKKHQTSIAVQIHWASFSSDLWGFTEITLIGCSLVSHYFGKLGYAGHTSEVLKDLVLLISKYPHPRDQQYQEDYILSLQKKGDPTTPPINGKTSPTWVILQTL